MAGSAYRTGTIAVTNGSPTVTGTTTGWSSAVRAGDWLHVGNNVAVEIASVDSNTQLTLVQNYPFTTLSGASYAISQGPAWNDVTRLAIDVANALANSTEILSGIGVPSNSLGSDGSAYFRQDAPELYFKTSGSWGTAISLTGPTGPQGANNITSSTTSRTLNTGSMSFTVDAGKAIQSGMRMRVSNSGSNYMEGVVTSYSGTTLTISMDRFVGSGTFAVWAIAPVGDKGDTGATGPSYAGTSTTSLTIATGSTGAFTTQAGLAYVIGSRIRLASSASPANYMEGTVTAYSGTSMTVNVDAIGGSGTIASWNLSIAGIQGAQGIQGIQGNTGSTGPAGPGYAATSTTSNSVATGNKTFTTQAGLSYVVGSRARAADSANPATNWMEGVITAYSSTSMTIAVDSINGSGTITSWNISLAGSQGATGPTGPTGPAGPTYNATSSSTLTPATGSKSFTVATGLPFLVGQRLRAADSANPTTNWMSGIVASYSSTTLTLTVDLIGSAPASSSSWNLSLTGEKGDQGPSGGFGSLLATKGNWPLADGTTYGALSVGANGSLPLADSTATYGISWTASSALIAGGYWSSTDVASAGTCDIGAVATPVVNITGTTTITSFGVVANCCRFVKFAGSLTLTYNGTSLVLPGTANIITQAGDCGIFVSDVSGNWKCVAWTPVGFIPREKLTANRTYYVRTDGSDSNSGRVNTSGGAFLTIQKALDVVVGNIDFAGFTVTVQIADGTYAAGFTLLNGWTGGGTLNVFGNTTTPANVIVQASMQNSATLPGTLNVRGIKTTGSAGLRNFGIGIVAFQNMDFGATSGLGQIVIGNQGAIIQPTGAYAISAGGGTSHIWVTSGVFNSQTTLTVSISGNPTWTYFISGIDLAVIVHRSTTYSVTGSVTAIRYNATTNSVIDTNSAGATYFPGSSAGTTGTGGQYL